MTLQRKPFVAGNWKMFNTLSEARHLISEMLPGLVNLKNVEKVICPPFPTLLSVKAMLEGTDIGLGAQNLFWEEKGAFTGEVSVTMVAEFCKYVIIGHSERRAFFGETNDSVSRKVRASLLHSLIPIVCVGETLEEKEKNLTSSIVTKQLKEGLSGVNEDLLNNSLSTQNFSLVVAYEPVWAIGTGKAATPEGANDVIETIIRPVIAELFGSDFAEAVRVLYGGSVKGDNAKTFFNQPGIDGALVGGASLKASEFISIVEAAT